LRKKTGKNPHVEIEGEDKDSDESALEQSARSEHHPLDSSPKRNFEVVHGSDDMPPEVAAMFAATASFGPMQTGPDKLLDRVPDSEVANVLQMILDHGKQKDESRFGIEQKKLENDFDLRRQEQKDQRWVIIVGTLVFVIVAALSVVFFFGGSEELARLLIGGILGFLGGLGLGSHRSKTSKP